MRWVYLSPHFDDVVFSCGGMVWEQVQSGQPVEIWTLCAGEPDPRLPLSPYALSDHKRWKTGPDAVLIRRAEDDAAARALGAKTKRWSLPDAIYRQLPDQTWLINIGDDLWKPVHPQEQGVLERMAAWLASNLDKTDVLVSPLTLGNHVDHRLVRAAAERAAAQVGCALLYYPDYPYVSRPDVDWSGKIGEDWQKTCRTISPAALQAWQKAVYCYASQMSTFFADRADMESSLAHYLNTGGGACLWQPAAVV